MPKKQKTKRQLAEQLARIEAVIGGLSSDDDDHDDDDYFPSPYSVHTSGRASQGAGADTRNIAE